ncbi:very short patch repair endonuclease [Mesorhizobium sp. CA15]|uniref:very short patch repair endonuclease n=1 Tax=Mesorhizobium sp. CA15 TaxID=2876641 RepID=UPI0021E22857|nr:DNA mismatch endonuclease Vsr [Mesorhizobium sp. CA15]
MRKILGKDTKPELLVRRLAHGLGYRYRLHKTNLPGRPDLVFAAKKKVIFVHGCFWHMHNASRCRIAHQPKSNQAYWLPKLQRTALRDQTNQAALSALGWKVLTIWECETKTLAQVERRLIDFLE